MTNKDILSISGVKLSVTSCGIKKNNIEDLLLVTFCDGTNVAGAFSTSTLVSDTITWNKENLKSKIMPKALIVNSGNANCFTGKHGLYAIEKIVSDLSNKLNIKKESIYVSSTGVIGEKLPYQKIIDAIPESIENLTQDNMTQAARAIMTTDVTPKLLSVKSIIAGQEVNISVIAKGAGMAAPNLATVLSYIFTDAVIPDEILRKILLDVIDDSFNVFTIDGDMSTNDTVMIFATGAAGNKTPASFEIGRAHV